MNEDKAKAIELGERAGEEYAMYVYETGGIDALTATLRPRAWEGYAKDFYELWEGGEEPWQEHAFNRGLAKLHAAHPYYHKAFDEVFARGARRCAEMLVRGYLDARRGVPFEAPTGGSELERAKARVAFLQQRTRLGDRPLLIAAYETGHKLYTKEASHG